MSDETNTLAPDAELLLAPDCPHCPAVLTILSELVKQGRLGELRVINIIQRPDLADARGVRSVPWLRIGPFELTGAQSRAEIETWIDRVEDSEGMEIYLRDELASGQLANVTAACRRDPALLPHLLSLAADLDTPLSVRIGVGAVLEDIAESGLPATLIDAITPLADSEHAQIRADAAHFLGLLQAPAAYAKLEALSEDPDPQVREIATDSLDA